MAYDDRPIGIFDSGIGGLTVVRAVRELLPDEPLIYLGDTARVPYGTKTGHTVTRYAHQVARILLDRDIKMLVVACNTASAQALTSLREAYEDDGGVPSLGLIQGKPAAGPVRAWGRIPVIGVIEPGVRAALDATAPVGRVGVIGTEGTILTGAYQQALSRRRPAIEVVAAACPLFVPLVEEGKLDGPLVELVAEEYLAPLRDRGVDTMILGCTHYPLLRPVIQRTMGDAVTLVDSAPTTAEEIRRVLDSRGGRARPGGGGVTFVATDHPHRFRRVGSLFLHQDIETVEVVDL